MYIHLWQQNFAVGPSLWGAVIKDGDAEVNFEPHLNSSWVLRPRMLIAAGYSTCPDVPKAQAGPVLLEDLEEGQIKRISQIGTEKWMKYNISVDSWRAEKLL